MDFKLGIVLLLIPICSSQTDSTKWVWGNNRNRNEPTRVITGDKRYNGELASLSKPLFQSNSNYNGDLRLANKYRYEVTETPYPSDYNTYRPRPPEQYKPRPQEQYKPRPPEQYKPRPPEQYRPDFVTNRPVYPYRPPTDFTRPTNSLDNYRPTNRPFENEYRPIGNGYRPPNGDYYLHGLRPGVGTNGKPILTGPTPSWEDDGYYKYKDYDVCKCVHSFNCNTPGIKFGSCDVDKQYCCYKSKQTEGLGTGGRPITNIYERPRPRPVLAGPGGPVDVPGRPYQDKFTSGRPVRPDVEKYVDSEREFNEAYKKGLASAVFEVSQRPNAYYDRDPQGYRDYYQPDRDYYRPIDNFQSSHPTKYGLYDPSAGFYSRSSNSTITAISDSKN